jgi:hypothetical protein
MLTRSMILTLAVGCWAGGCVAGDTGDLSADDPTAETSAATSSPWTCSNNVASVACVGSIALLQLINVDVKNVRALNDNELTVLSNDLNYLSILDGGVLNNNTILNDVELTVLDDFLNKFIINVTKNDIDVCTSVLGILLCK